MKKHKVYFKSYNAEIDIPILVISGNAVTHIARVFEAIGINLHKVLTVTDEEPIEEFEGTYILYFCSKFLPTVDYIKDHDQYLFINTEARDDEEELKDCPNYRFCEGTRSLAEFTGISAIRGLKYDHKTQLFINQGQVSKPVEHTASGLARRFSAEMAKWIAAGSKYRDAETVKSLWETFCNQCAEYIPDKKTPFMGRCHLCGCFLYRDKISIRNKLSLFTTSCPALPPKWTAEIAVSAEEIKGREQELYQIWMEKQKEFGVQEGKLCDCKEEEV